METPSKFNCVILFDLKKRNYTDVKTPEDYKKLVKSMDAGCELVGNQDQQVKPYFDVDMSRPKSFTFEEVTECTKWCDIISSLFPNKKLDIKILKREPREKDGQIKYSYHLIVNNIRISYSNIKVLMDQKGLQNNAPFDTTIYNKNRGFHSIYTSHKINKDTGKKEKIPELMPYDYFQMKDMSKIDLFDYCVSYIKEDFEDWDAKMTVTQDKQDKVLTYKEVSKEDDDICDDGDTVTPLEKKLEEYLNHLSEKRADGRDEWLNMMFCIINICKKNNISRRKCENLLHLFSKRCKDRYNEDDVDKWIDINYDKTRQQGYGWNYLVHTCLKQDNPDYYEKRVGKTYYIVKKEFEKHVSKCMNPVGFLRVVRDELILNDNPDPYQFLTKDKLHHAYEELTYWGYVENKKGELS